VISATENSNKFQKIRFWKEKSDEDTITLGPMMAQATLVDMKEPINTCLFNSIIFILIQIKFDIDINTDELLEIV
jgi:hypothetical protein